jgi:uncharacterized protein (UPF0261 family)
VTPSVFVIATMDTKGRETAFVADCVGAAGNSAAAVDVGGKDPPVVPAPLRPRVEAAGSIRGGRSAVR